VLFYEAGFTTNATVIDDARFVSSSKSKDNCRSLDDSNEVDKEESKEPDYDEEQEDETGEITQSSTTTNQILGIFWFLKVAIEEESNRAHALLAGFDPGYAFTLLL